MESNVLVDCERVRVVGRGCAVRRHVLHHVRLLPERPLADRAHERLLASVNLKVRQPAVRLKLAKLCSFTANLKVLLEVESLAVDEQPADGTALVVRPVVVHVRVEGLQVGDVGAALDAVDGPEVVLHARLVVVDQGGLRRLPFHRRGRVLLGLVGLGPLLGVALRLYRLFNAHQREGLVRV